LTVSHNKRAKLPLKSEKLRMIRLGRPLSLVWRAARGWTLVSVLLLCLQAGLPLLQLYLMKLTVDAVAAGIGAPDKGAALNQVVFLVCLTGAAALVAILLDAVAKVVGQAQAEAVTDHVRSVLHAKSVALDLEFYENSRFYDTLHRAQQEAPYRPTRIVKTLVQVAQNCITLLGIVALLISCHWGITAVLFAAVIPGVFVRLKFADKMYHWQRDRSMTERRADYLNWLLTGEIHAKEIRLFDLGPLFIQWFRDLRQQLRREKISIVLRQAIGELAVQAGATIAIFGSLAFIAYRTVQGTMTLGDMVMYYQAFQRGQGYLRDMLGGLADLYEDNLFLSSFHDFLDLKSSVVPLHPRVPVPKPMKSGIVFDCVGFQYPSGDAKVLMQVSFTIRPGEVVALVGENGSGKTTLVKLLCRLYDPTDGTITLDGVDLRHFDNDALRREIGVIFQDYIHYQMTARDNVWMGNVQLPRDDDRIVAAAKYSGAHTVLQGLPQGYETMLGNWFGNGAELSIGQWQKVALARAFLRDAQIMVLDEPTSSMDVETEYAVFQNFRRLVSGRTALLISHRFSTVRMADRIYVLKDGNIIEGGTHEELIRLGGTYANLFEMQAKYYR
jgi:ATP-binding cassette, subfamily B, bacterial